MNSFKETIRESIKGVDDLNSWKIIEIISNHSNEDIDKSEIQLDEQIKLTL